jgi:ubiquinone/menaquinone biosynthesis C-methylase UbiE
MAAPWPSGFARIPDDEWTKAPLGELALKYDTVESHGWYSNLEHTVEQLDAALDEGQVLIDYSGGTGILARRLLERVGDRSVGIVLVDASPKFLRLALEKLRDEPRVAFRHLRWLDAEHRLELLDEVVPVEAIGRPVDALASTNAVHLYYDLADTLASWRRLLAPGGRAFVQSGNVRNPAAAPDEWIIDETVEAIHEQALALVAEDARWLRWRDAAADPTVQEGHAKLRRKFFLPVRPLEHYVDALEAAGFGVGPVETRRIEARVVEWFEFLAAYHEGVLGWVGGSRRVEGREPDEDAVRERLQLMRLAMDRVFGGADAFPCCWTYLTATSPLT